MSVETSEDLRKAILKANKDGGGVIQLLPMTYEIEGHIELTAPVRLSGAMADATVIRFQNPEGPAVRLNGSIRRGVRFRLENLRLEHGGGNADGIQIYFGQSVVLNHLAISGFHHNGIRIYQSIHTCIEHCRIFGRSNYASNSSGIEFDARQPGPPEDRGGTNLRILNTYISDYEYMVEANGANVLSVGGVYELGHAAFLVTGGCDFVTVGDYISGMDYPELNWRAEGATVTAFGTPKTH